MRLQRLFILMVAAGVAIGCVSTARAQYRPSQPSTTDNSTGAPPTQPNNVPSKPANMHNYGGASDSGYSNGVSAGGYDPSRVTLPGQNAQVGQLGPDSPDTRPPESLQIERDQARARNADRQRQLVADTQKLVSLAGELEAEVGRSNKDMLSLDVIHKAEEIEKLAHTVRDKMKNAN